MSVKVMLELHIQPELTDEITLVVLEQWTTPEAYEAYFTWRTERGNVANLEAISSSPPTLTCYDFRRGLSRRWAPPEGGPRPPETVLGQRS